MGTHDFASLHDRDVSDLAGAGGPSAKAKRAAVQILHLRSFFRSAPSAALRWCAGHLCAHAPLAKRALFAQPYKGLIALSHKMASNACSHFLKNWSGGMMWHVKLRQLARQSALLGNMLVCGGSE